MRRIACPCALQGTGKYMRHVKLQPAQEDRLLPRYVREGALDLHAVGHVAEGLLRTALAVTDIHGDALLAVAVEARLSMHA